MSLATRCASCGTVFRVAQDQLKVSAGWVRCGRCDEAFNALEGLFDLEAEPDAVPLAAPAAAERVEPAFDALGHSADHATPASRVAERDRVEFADARFGADDGDEDADDDSGDAAATDPEFLRQADRRPRRPRVGLALSTVLLALLLAAQAVFHYRDLLAAVWPPARPALVALCAAVGCRIEAPRRIDDIVIESSALTAAPSGDALRLAVVLRNRGALALAMPSIELALTDAGGQLLVRRALAPADFGAPNATLPAAAETSLQLLLSTGARRAAGYTVEPFYP